MDSDTFTLNSLSWSQGAQGKYEVQVVPSTSIPGTLIGVSIRSYASLKADDFVQPVAANDHITLISNKNSFTNNATFRVRIIYKPT